MPRGRPIDPGIVRNVFNLSARGCTYRQIATAFGKCRDWAKYVLKSYDCRTLELRKKKKRGGKRKTTLEEDAAIVNYGKQLPDSPITEVTARINEGKEVQTQISRGTVQRRLKEAGARAVTAIPDELTADHKKRRVKFCFIFTAKFLYFCDYRILFFLKIFMLKKIFVDPR